MKQKTPKPQEQSYQLKLNRIARRREFFNKLPERLAQGFCITVVILLVVMFFTAIAKNLVYDPIVEHRAWVQKVNDSLNERPKMNSVNYRLDAIERYVGILKDWGTSGVTITDYHNRTVDERIQYLESKVCPETNTFHTYGTNFFWYYSNANHLK